MSHVLVKIILNSENKGADQLDLYFKVYISFLFCYFVVAVCDLVRGVDTVLYLP